ncbi:MAG: dimethylsulfonioproprionate lyase family protein [Rhodospirillales bacterium]
MDAENLAGETTQRISQHPDWKYVLREFYNVYRFSSSGGSKLIGAHMRVVQARLSRVLTSDPALNLIPPDRKPVTAHLGRTLDNGEEERTHSFVRALAKISGELTWQYGYDKMPRSLENKYAYSEIMGPRGPIVCDDLILGLVLFAPDCTYPAHSHSDITESYYCLSGFVSQNHAGVYPPGSLLFNAPGYEHAITTSKFEPVLLAYVWVGDVQTLGGFQMSFSRKRKIRIDTPI